MRDLRTINLPQTLNRLARSSGSLIKTKAPDAALMLNAQDFSLHFTLRVQVPSYHILSKIVTYITTVLNPST